ncbi:hypothetical protein EIP86_010143 [Pleurotus ostreatoroseus]|nr:hypothetical protein EIP86_010143 [Pleurotus ostreatoroseus]
MSTTSTPNGSPLPVQPLHNPSQAAKVVVPQAPVGKTVKGPVTQAPGMGARALLAKKLAKSANPSFVSPTDNALSPCTKKINEVKKKHFTKGARPMPSLFSPKDADSSQSSSGDESDTKKMDDEENPF